MSLVRFVLLPLGLFFALPLLGLLCLLPGTPITVLGATYLAGGLLIAAALISAFRWRRRTLLLLLVGTTCLLGPIVLRTLFPPAGSRLFLATLPDRGAPRWLNRLFDEQDVVLVGARLAPYLGFVSAKEKRALVPTLARTYREMQEQGVTPLSPFLLTYLVQQRPDAFDALISQPVGEPSPSRGIIFLHGFGGNFTLQCWLMVRASDAIGAITVCPSTGPIGAWWSPQGEAILMETINYLQGRGVERIYFAGLSNGGIGVSRLAHRFQEELAGLILISGADPQAPNSGLPTLVVHGKEDERIPVEVMERYAATIGPAGRYLLFDGDHFLLLKEADRVQGAIAEWLTQEEGRREGEAGPSTGYP